MKLLCVFCQSESDLRLLFRKNVMFQLIKFVANDAMQNTFGNVWELL